MEESSVVHRKEIQGFRTYCAVHILFFTEPEILLNLILQGLQKTFLHIYSFFFPHIHTSYCIVYFLFHLQHFVAFSYTHRYAYTYKIVYTDRLIPTYYIQDFKLQVSRIKKKISGKIFIPKPDVLRMINAVDVTSRESFKVIVGW